MPNTKSAKKRLKQNEARRLRNRVTRTALKSQVKKVRVAAAAGDLDAANAAFTEAVKKADQAASARRIHPNAAARTKSRLSALLKKTKAAAK